MGMTILFLCVGNLTKGKMAAFKKRFAFTSERFERTISLGEPVLPTITQSILGSKDMGND